MSKYLVDEVDAAARNLNDVLEIICEFQFELYLGKADRRLDSLMWIARDLSEGIVIKLDEESARRVRV